jgi:hypothetical protein
MTENEIYYKNIEDSKKKFLVGNTNESGKEKFW